MQTVILFTGRDENGVFHKSEDSNTHVVKDTGVITHNNKVVGQLQGNTRKATIEDINNAIKGNVDFKLSIESDKYWFDGKLEVS